MTTGCGNGLKDAKNDPDIHYVTEEASSVNETRIIESASSNETFSSQKTDIQNIDTDIVLPFDFWNEFSWGSKTTDGYNLEFNVKVSDLISFEAPKTANAVWTQLGGNSEDIPDLQSLRNVHPYWENGNYETGYYIMGTYAIKNKTDGFHFSYQKTYECHDYLLGNSYTSFTPGYLTVAGDSVERPLHAAVMYIFTNSGKKVLGGSVDSIFRSDSVDYGLDFIVPTMESDDWGPVKFMIVIPDAKTPNQPNGFDSLNYLYWSNYSPKINIDQSFFEPEKGNTGTYSAVPLHKINSDTDVSQSTGAVSTTISASIDSNNIDGYSTGNFQDFWESNSYFDIVSYLKANGADNVYATNLNSYPVEDNNDINVYVASFYNNQWEIMFTTGGSIQLGHASCDETGLLRHDPNYLISSEPWNEQDITIDKYGTTTDLGYLSKLNLVLDYLKINHNSADPLKGSGINYVSQPL